MEIVDEVYGKEEITEPVLLELINCKSVQRLKGVSQYGIPDEYYYKKNFSRFEHSLGVLILLKRLGADLKEQIAGLLHDVSHTAFSHVVDGFIGDPTKEDYQDKIHLNFIENSEIPFILKKYGFDSHEISKLESFSLLDKGIPSLCADRIDYCLRELKQEGKFETIKKIIFNLISLNGQIAFSDVETANLFAKNYMFLQTEHWAGEQARARYYLLSEALKIAMDEGLISIKDFMKKYLELIQLLLESKNPKLLRQLNLLKNGFSILESNEGIELRKKFRYVDPEVLVEGNIYVLSELSKDYFNFINAEKENSKSFKKIIVVEK